MKTLRASPVLTAALVVVGVLLAATVVALLATSRSTDEVRTDLASAQTEGTQAQSDLKATTAELTTQRTELATLLSRLQSADDYLGLRTDARNEVAESLDKTRSELSTLSEVLRTNQVNVFIQAKQAADLQSCITKADQALNVLSHGDKDLGAKLLAESSQGCQAVSEYLKSKGVQP